MDRSKIVIKMSCPTDMGSVTEVGYECFFDIKLPEEKHTLDLGFYFIPLSAVD